MNRAGWVTGCLLIWASHAAAQEGAPTGSGPVRLWSRDQLAEMLQPATVPAAEAMAAQVSAAPAPGTDRAEAYRALLTELGVPEELVEVRTVPVPDEDWFRLWRSQWTASLREAGMGPLDAEAVLRAEEARLRATPGRSVLVRLPGQTSRQILVATALDAPRGGTGVVDNWSSCVVLANLCAALRQRTSRHTLVLAAFDAEEEGSLGARSYLDGLAEDLRTQTDAMIQLECLGMGPPALWEQGCTGSMKSLAGLVARLSGIPVELREYADVSAGSGDAAPFRRAGIPTLAMDGIHLEKARFLGTSGETAALVEGDHLVGAFRLAYGVLALLDPHEERLTTSVLQERLPLEPEDELVPVPVLLLGTGGPVRVGLDRGSSDR